MNNCILGCVDLAIEICIRSDDSTLCSLLSTSRLMAEIDNQFFWRSRFQYLYEFDLGITDYSKIYKEIIYKSYQEILYYAIAHNFIRLVDYSIAHGADTTRDDTRSIVLAFEYGHIEIIKHLITLGVDINSQIDMVALAAVKGKHLELVMYLAEIGFDLGPDNFEHGEYLMYAIENNDYPMVEYFSKQDIEDVGYFDIPLVSACIIGSFDMVQLFISLGADLHHEDDEAIRNAAEYGRLEIVKYLVNHGADVRAQNDYVLATSIINNHYHILRYVTDLLGSQLTILS